MPRQRATARQIDADEQPARVGESARRPEEQRRPLGEMLLQRVVVVDGRRSGAILAELAAEEITARRVDIAALQTLIAGLVVFEVGERLEEITAALQAHRRRQAPVAALALGDLRSAATTATLRESARAGLPGSSSGGVVSARLRVYVSLLATPPPSDEPEVIRVRNFEIDLERREVRAGGRLVPLTPSEFRILALLARRPGRVVSLNEIFYELHGHLAPEQEVKDNLKVHMWRLRAKLADVDPDVHAIVNVRGFGYMLERRLGRERRAQPSADGDE